MKAPELFTEDLKYTSRGFSYREFRDDYNTLCTLQESSACDPHIWLGVNDANPIILCADAEKLGLPVHTAGYWNGRPTGWQAYEVPKEVSFTTRMHLTPQQARELGHKLIKWANTGEI